uniref:Uncharacterized protein n=1 Tax=viral metagenome TaxID=1070528 RepID=A0A6C0DN65_9ZZZZ
MSWKSFDNDLSVDIATLTPERNFNFNVPKSIVSKLSSDKRLNLFPFKIVTLQWLIDIGKATPKNDNANLCFPKGSCGNYFMLIFSSNDKYLPVGDIFVQGTSNPYDMNQIPILLIKNDPDYSTIIDRVDYNWYGDEYQCPGGQDTGFYTYRNNDGVYKGDYQVVSSFLTIAGFWDRNRGYNPVFAAVKRKYLKEIDGASFYLGSADCYHDFEQLYSTPFYTFFSRSSREGGGAFKTFDIIPRILFASCCAGTIPDSIDTKYCGDFYNNESACRIGMSYYCKGDNLNTAECKSYCKNNDCDTNLEAYCSAGTYEDQKKKYNEQKEICSCFMPRTFYEKKDDEFYSAMGPGGKQLVDLLKASGVYGGRPECSDLQCKFGGTTLQHKTFTAGSCPNIQIQNCLNSASMNNKGNLQGAVSTDQANNCVQQSTTQNSPSPLPQPSPSSPTPSSPTPQSSPTPSSPTPQSSPSPSPTSPSSDNTMLYLIIGGVILLILIILIVVVLLI